MLNNKQTTIHDIQLIVMFDKKHTYASEDPTVYKVTRKADELKIGMIGMEKANGEQEQKRHTGKNEHEKTSMRRGNRLFHRKFRIFTGREGDKLFENTIKTVYIPFNIPSIKAYKNLFFCERQAR